MQKKSLNINNQEFLIYENILSEYDRNSCLEDIVSLISAGYVAKSVPPLQTPPDLFQHVKFKSHWLKLLHFIKTNTKKNLKLQHSWANLSVKNGYYSLHTHSTDLTFCYFLVSMYPEFGTNIDNNVIIPAVENSITCFSGKVPHSITNLPNELIEDDKYVRCSIVFDFDIIGD